MNIKRIAVSAIIILAAQQASGIEDKIELDAMKIIANEELPGVLYLVPWKDTDSAPIDNQQLRLHDFFGDLYEPIMPTDIFSESTNFD